MRSRSASLMAEVCARSRHGSRSTAPAGCRPCAWRGAPRRCCWDRRRRRPGCARRPPRARGSRAPACSDHLLVDPLRGAAQREFAQRGQVAGREIVADRALGLVRHIDLAVLQPLDQVVGRQVDQLDVVGPVDDRVRHRLAHADAGDPGDDVVQAFDVLDVERGVDVDAGGEQLLDIHVALGMPAARRVGVRELIDQRELRPARQQRVEVHLLQPAPSVFDRAARDDLEAFEQRLGFACGRGSRRRRPRHRRPPAARLRRGEHLVGLADAGRGAEEHLQPAARSLLRGFQQRIG